MKNKMSIKILLDVIMAIIWLLLMDYKFTGLNVHEIIGLIIFGILVIHLLFNCKWITIVSKNLFKKNTNVLTTIKYIIDFVLLIFIILITVSGILISRTILLSITSSNRHLWTYIHRFSSYGALILISIHIGLNWNVIMGQFRKLFRIKKPSIIRTITLRILSLIIVILGIKSSFDNHLGSKFIYEKGNGNNNRKSLDNELKVEGISFKESSSQTKIYFTKGNKKQKVQDFSDNSPKGDESLEDYLNRLTCSGCGRRCPLISPQCSVGQGQAQQATQHYSDITSQNNNSNSDNNSNNSTKDNNPFLGNNGNNQKNNHGSSKGKYKNEITFNDDEEGSLEKLFSSMIPVMGMYIAGTYYTVKFVRRVK